MGRFRSFSYSTKGANHKKSGLPCQDDSLDNDNNHGKVSIAVVADGHGSAHFFRSDTGSKVAAEVAINGIKDFIDQNPKIPEAFINGDGRKILDRLARHVISSWFTCVSDDETQFPLANDERMATIEDKQKNKYLNDPDRQHFCHAYGTTLIAAAITENYWFGFHIGDGKCVTLYEDGAWEQPIPWDDNCFLNSTTSICDDDSIDKFRYWFGFRQDDGKFLEYRYGIDGQNKDEIKTLSDRPIAIFIGSDGVDDTYPVNENEKHLKYLYRSIVLSFAANGFDRTSAQILELAKKLAEQGSQDDVSIAGIIGDLCEKADLIEKLKLQAEQDMAKEKAEAARKNTASKKIAVQTE